MVGVEALTGHMCQIMWLSTSKHYGGGLGLDTGHMCQGLWLCTSKHYGGDRGQ